MVTLFSLTLSETICPFREGKEMQNSNPRTAVLLAALAMLLVSTVLSTAPSFAQTPTAIVNGTVVDSSGASVPDAQVAVVNQNTNLVNGKKTSADGTFTIINLLPGNYILTVEKSGFKRVALPTFKLDV